MFKKRAIQVSVIKTPAMMGVPNNTSSQALTPEQINEIAKDQIQTIAVAVGATIIAAIFAGAAADIITDKLTD
jgi:hypothetical protein